MLINPPERHPQGCSCKGCEFWRLYDHAMNAPMEEIIDELLNDPGLDPDIKALIKEEF